MVLVIIVYIYQQQSCHEMCKIAVYSNCKKHNQMCKKFRLWTPKLLMKWVHFTNSLNYELIIQILCEFVLL